MFKQTSLLDSKFSEQTTWRHGWLSSASNWGNCQKHPSVADLMGQTGKPWTLTAQISQGRRGLSNPPGLRLSVQETVRGSSQHSQPGGSEAKDKEGHPPQRWVTAQPPDSNKWIKTVVSGWMMDEGWGGEGTLGNKSFNKTCRNSLKMKGLY